ncbi:hypothetical protein N7G274_008835 [Stereocaulon virgatum]|uniref:SAC3/GANP/THP3 conserved domain-containing protein n=1 Tax=Stereocaulon virgatum TaxID=373712 RepID=A0ABR4A0L6_9LECA
MSVPQGPRASNNTRGRGIPRGGIRSRDPKNTEVSGGDRATRRPSPYNATRSSESRHLQPTPNQGIHHHSSRGKPRPHGPLTSAILNHAGKIPDPQLENWRNPATVDSRTYKQRMIDLFQTLKQNREKERKEAIKDGFLADPDKPTSLANAITPVGTCQEMCPEFERVERIVQLMVDGSEKIPSTSDPNIKVPCEQLMVKRFRRSAAGYDEQLPSDIRPPAVLQQTLNYLFNDVLGGTQPLATVHKFVWDRTRGIRNDFSIQQVTRTEDLKIAIDCFERIARFHILSLHQLSRLQSVNGEFDAHQEREQLNNTLLSLMYYYDDSRHKLTSPNEAEFRAYCIVFEIQDLRPDLEDRAQSWPRPILKDPRVQTAFKLYAAAANTSDDQGPLRPKTQFLTAQANTRGFWNLVQSHTISYLMACVAEIYFNLVRRTALEAIWKAYKGKRGGPTKMNDWTLKDLTPALGFDSEEQTETFCKEHEFEIAENENGEAFVDLGSVVTGNLTDQNPRRKQVFSRHLVEAKRLGRTLSAVINGISASQAQVQGFIDDSSDAELASIANSESLFVDGSSDDEGKPSRSRSASSQKKTIVNGHTLRLNSAAAPFSPSTPSQLGKLTKSNPFQGAATFGLPSSTPSSRPPQLDSASPFNPASKQTTSSPFGPFANKVSPIFDFHAAANKVKQQTTTESPGLPVTKDPPTFKFISPSTKVQGTDNNTKASPVGPSVGLKESFFRESSNSFPASKAVEPVKPASGPSSIIAATNGSLDPKSIFDQPSKPAAQANVSFATSPLFALGTMTSSNGNHQVPPLTLSQKFKGEITDDISSQAKQAKATISDFAAKPIEPVAPPARDSSKPITFFPNIGTNATPSAFAPQPPPISTSSIISTPIALSPETKRADDTNQSAIQSTSSMPLSFSSTTPAQPKVQEEPQNLILSNLSTSSGSASLAFAPAQSRQGSLSSTNSQLDLRQAALDKLCDAVMWEDKGLLQQFIEHIVGPIITSSLAQLEDEWSWEEARECRIMLLSKKYFKKWRVNAWNIGLIRKGRERRRNLVMSIQRSVRISPQGLVKPSSSLAAEGLASSLLEYMSPAKLMAPPGGLTCKRQSLPADFGPEQALSDTAAGTKRKRDDPIPSANEILPKPTKIVHRRSQTVGNSMSAPPYRVPHPVHRPRVDASQVREGSMFHEVLMKQARRLAPNAKSDTTRTDYFRLKALGIDPDTPIIPLTKKRTRNEVEVNGASRATKSSPQDPPSSHTNKTYTAQTSIQESSTPSKPADDADEALFASLRSVREALAESEQWMQSERQSIERQSTERAATPQTNASSPDNATPAQRRLREIKERGHTPSRTEIRLRAMGNKALLPKGFWDGEGMGKSLYGKGKHKDAMTPTPLPGPSFQPSQQMGPSRMGFAALGAQGHMNGQFGLQRQMHNQFGLDGQINGQFGMQNMSEIMKEEPKQKTGASVEDAIEL